MTATAQATDLLGSMIAGITASHHAMGADTPDLSASEFQTVGDSGVAATLHLPDGQGDFRVTVEPV